MSLGHRQIRLLMTLANPTFRLVVPDKVSLSLERLGFVVRTAADDYAPGTTRITSVGLRRLAMEMESGALDRALEKLRKGKTKEGGE